MNLVSFKFIIGFIAILIISLVTLVYFSGIDTDDDVNTENNIAKEQNL